MPEPASSVFSRRIAASCNEIHPLGDAITEWASARGVPPKVTNSMFLMLDELLTNVVMHGFGDSGKGTIDVTLALDGEFLVATVRDQAPAFDPFSIAEPDTTLAAEDRDIGGLGVHFVRRMSDGYGYRRDGDCNEVTLRKRLA